MDREQFVGRNEDNTFLSVCGQKVGNRLYQSGIRNFQQALSAVLIRVRPGKAPINMLNVRCTLRYGSAK